MEAALSAFGKKGYHDTQVSDIIAQAKVARGTFYLYFDGKREIISFFGGAIRMARTLYKTRLGMTTARTWGYL